jgi:branched-chain amino acid transport system permease protein
LEVDPLQLFLEQLLNGLAIGAIYGLTTLGLALVYGILRILHVAHAGVYAVGAYVGLFAAQWTGSLLMGVLLAGAVSSLLGVAIERLFYFPLLKYPPYVPLIGSIAVFISLEELIRLVAGPEIRSFPAEIPLPPLKLGVVTVSPPLLAVYLTTGLVLLSLWFVTTRTEFGLAMRAASQDMEVASSLGVNSHRVVSLTFVIGSFTAALAGVLVGVYYNQVYPSMGAVPAYKTLALIVVGGMGSVPGAVMASLLLGVAETLLIGYANVPLPRDALAFIAMILVLLVRPKGLFARRSR